MRFSKDIDRLSGGKFQIKFFEPGALVPALECFDAASKGSVEACWTTPGYHTGKLGAGVAFFTAVSSPPCPSARSSGNISPGSGSAAATTSATRRTPSTV